MQTNQCCCYLLCVIIVHHIIFEVFFETISGNSIKDHNNPLYVSNMFIYQFKHNGKGESPRGEIIKLLACEIVESEFKL